jgi:hypothetical protein
MKYITSPYHAQSEPFDLIIVDLKSPKFRQEIRSSHYRNDSLKYDLNDKSD